MSTIILDYSDALKIDYEKLIKTIHNQNPKNITDLIYLIVAIYYNDFDKKLHMISVAYAINVIREFDNKIEEISYLSGAEISQESMREYNKTHSIKIPLSWI